MKLREPEIKLLQKRGQECGKLSKRLLRQWKRQLQLSRDYRDAFERDLKEGFMDGAKKNMFNSIICHMAVESTGLSFGCMGEIVGGLGVVMGKHGKPVKRDFEKLKRQSDKVMEKVEFFYKNMERSKLEHGHILKDHVGDVDRIEDMFFVFKMFNKEIIPQEIMRAIEKGDGPDETEGTDD